MIKHFWHILDRRDSLWVRWIHHRYLGVVDPLEWEPHRRDSPLIKAILHARDQVEKIEGRELGIEETLSSWCKEGKFRVALAYDSIRDRRPSVSWYKEVWASHNTPKHMFILCLPLLNMLSTYDRLLFLDIDPGCRLCEAELETHDHLFFDCPYTTDICRELRVRFMIPAEMTSISCVLSWLRQYAHGQDCLAKGRVFALSATVYHIWHARNARIFDDNSIPREVLVRLIITHVFRLLYDIFPISMVMTL